MVKHKIHVALSCSLMLLCTHMCWSAERTRAVVDVTLVDNQAIAFATFQSHNQKVVSNQHGIFMTYVHKSNHDYTGQQWRLAQSVDGGKTFSTVYEAVHATSAPAIETDARGVLYLGHPDFVGGNAYLLKVEPSRHAVVASTTTLTGGAAGKYCLLLDVPRQQLYWFAHNNTFFIVGTNGEVRGQLQLLKSGAHAYLQYPHLTLDAAGALYAAWTTSKVISNGDSIYHDIHAMKSLDGGLSWQTLDGQPLALPVTADDTGRATQISADDEFDVHTWLSALMSKGGKLHFAYWANTSPQRQRYLRYDESTGTADVSRQPVFAGRPAQQPNDSGAFVTCDRRADSRLYFVSTVDDRHRLACLASDDNGLSWYEYAISDQRFSGRVYSIGAARQCTQDGAIVGTFTEVVDDPETYYEDHSGRVFFYRIQENVPQP